MQNSHDFGTSSSSNNASASASNVGFNGDREFPVGYRFCPTDYELVVYYLKNKIINQPLPHDKIGCVNLYDHRPSELANSCQPLGDVGDGEWYFFTPRDKKYPNGSRPNRAADTGFWKATGATQSVVSHEYIKLSEAEKKEKAVGRKRTLVFYEGKPPKGKKTNWIMHEYQVNSSDAPQHVRRDASDMKLDDWVLCRIHHKEKKMQAAKDEELFDDEDDEHQQITMNNDQQSVMYNINQQILTNNNQQNLTNNDQQNLTNNDQQNLTNNETGYNLAPFPQYMDYNNPMSMNYIMHHQEPKYEIYPPELDSLNFGDFSNNPSLMTILQNASYLDTNHHHQQQQTRKQ